MNEQKVGSSPREFFLYLLSSLTLAITFSCLMALLFSFINIAFPILGSFEDPHFSEITWHTTILFIRWLLTVLIISFPVYLYTLIKIRSDYQKNEAKQNLKVRKWWLNFILFITVLIILIALGTLVYNLLGGDLPVRFLLKTLTLLLSASLLFAFYRGELNLRWTSRTLKYWFYSVALVFFAVVVYSFYLIGSPYTVRKQQSDQKRITNLTLLQNHIMTYWAKNKQLPTSIQDLTNSSSNFRPPVDPITKAAYGYHVLSDNSFQLCAEFATASAKRAMVYQTNNKWNWQHPAGYYCFTRSIESQTVSSKP